MSSIAFDAHKFVKRLQSSGLPPEQAEALVDALKDAVADSLVAAKHDLAELKYDLLKWIVGLALAQFGLLIGILLRLA